MANTSSAKKAVRQIARRTEVNRTRRSRMRSYLRKVEEAIASGNQESARAALAAAEPDRFRVVDAQGDVEQVGVAIDAIAAELLAATS